MKCDPMSRVPNRQPLRSAHKRTLAYAAAAAVMVGSVASVYAVDGEPAEPHATGDNAGYEAPGAANPQGPRAAATGWSGYQVVSVSKSINMAPGASGKYVTAPCPRGKKVLGGGYSSGGFFTFMNNGPVNDDRWQVLVVNRHTAAFNANVTVYAICANVS